MRTRTSAVLFVILALAGCTSGAEQRQNSRATTWRAVATWTGTGTKTIESFPILAGRLRVSWETQSQSSPTDGAFKLRLHSADSGRILDEIVDGTGQARGSKEVLDDHQRFYLSVESTGLSWTIRVEEGITTVR